MKHYPLRAITLLFLIGFLFLSMQSADQDYEDQVKQEKLDAFKMMLTSGDCEWNGIKLYGKVEFVEHFPDIKIEYVDITAEQFKDKMQDYTENLERLFSESRELESEIKKQLVGLDYE